MQSKVLAAIKLLTLSLIAFAVLMVAQLSARADVITFSSNGGPGESNSTGSPTVLIPPHPAWASAMPGSAWVSFMTQTGDPGAANYVVVAQNTVVTFNHTFTLNGPAVAGTLSVRADDSTSVILNGFVLASEADMAGNSYGGCSDVPIGCTGQTQRTFTFAEFSPHLVNGVNTLSFGVAQRAGSSFGLNYSGSVTTDPVPEPATLTLLGSSLLGLAGAARRRRRNARKSDLS
jgi:PEP-CTERM motif